VNADSAVRGAAAVSQQFPSMPGWQLLLHPCATQHNHHLQLFTRTVVTF
jgi:hypothetical protein